MKTVANLYNPHEQSKEELIAGFVVRLPLFEKLFKVIKDSDMQYPEQHYLIEAQRGMGKTTLLLRLSYEIENDAELNQWLIPLVFKEESYYHISRLFKLWEHCASLLEDKQPEFSGLPAQMESLQDADYERACFELLLARLKQQQKKLLLFIDNIGEMFMSFDEKDCRRLREVLMTCPYLRVFGATAVTLEAYFNYQHPFYEFFKKVSLPNLGKEDTHTLLQELAKQGGAQQEQLIQTIIEQQPGRVESLRILTGGVVRSIVLLFELFLDQKNGDSLKDLDKVLDTVTPLYKHRMDDLKPLQREVVDAIALNWDAITPEEIARATRREVAQVSEALASLAKFFIVQRVATETSIDLYQLQERFFNIWYLMRNAPKASQARVVWLVRFLQSWYDADSLTQRARKHIQALQKGNYYPKAAFYFAEAMAATGQLDEETQHELLQQTKAFLADKDKELMQALSPSDKELFQQAMDFFENDNYQQAISLLLKIKQKNELVYLYLGISYRNIENYVEAEECYLKVIERYNKKIELFGRFPEQYKEVLISVKLAQGGVEYLLALLYENHKQDYAKAEQYYLMAAENGNVVSMNSLAWDYFEQLKKQAEALKLAEQAVTTERNIYYTHTLACIYVWANQFEKATETAAFFLHEEESYQKFEQDIVLYLMLLLAKQQYASLADYFNTPQKNYRDRFKPLYYAYLNLSQHPDFAKCPPELTEPVNDILQKVEQLKRDYA